MSFVHPCNRERVCIFVCASYRKGGKLKPMRMLRTKCRHGLVFNHSGSMLCTFSKREKESYVSSLTLPGVCVR